MSTEIFELSEQEMLATAGGSQVEPSAAQTSDYPIVDNNPPG
ncbi:hypothetical protein [Massilia eburnea]|nr:hypothetical protein [Massilia eburnea]